ncbi:MAG: site-specific DNA-methyltransferase [Bacteroidales bacterium]|nr:site-specific DNA-methyltransferase [Bacteroidales bacterium]HNW72312.1 site-specific DNA-methyltransferase [Bacteroidales bacterium]
MAKKIDSIKHSKDTRVHIPSKEEAGYEEANSKVQSGKKILEIPKNPVVHRGQDPELFWLNKYGNDDRDDLLRVDIRSLYRHEHIAPETLIKNLYKLTETKSDQLDLFSINELFGNALEKDELEKVGEYYHHQDGWTNRLIQGDSHLVMASLLEREGMAGQVQMMYFDPPYGINYSSNWQVKITNTNVKESSDDDLSGEPEVIKAFRDTWEYGIHSYLSYLRDRLLIALELLHETGSCFVQISSQNVHLVRSLMDEVFGSDNFVSQIAYRTKNMTIDTKLLGSVNDFIVWYAKDKEKVKYRKLYQKTSVEGDTHWNMYQLPDGSIHKMTTDQIHNHKLLPKDADPVRLTALYPIGFSKDRVFDVEFEGKTYKPATNRSWKFDLDGFKKLVAAKRIMAYNEGRTINYILKLSDYPVSPMHSLWHETAPASSKEYVVQTSTTPIQRCIQMTTDPGDLVVDPTCGSGTTAFVAEMYGRRWITIDTSRIALNIAKLRLMSATFPYFKLYDEEGSDIRQGFIYDKAPHLTLESITGSEPSEDVTLFDNPKKDNKKLRVSGPFTVETLQNFEPVSPDELDDEIRVNEEEGAFEEVIKQHLISAGVKNGRKDEHVVFTRIELLSHSYLHAEGFYQTAKGEAKAYFHIGPKFGTVSKKSVSEAVKECQSRGDATWLVILGFSFESDIQGSVQTMSVGNFEVTKARIHDDLLQDGLKKKPAKAAASFVTIGEPDIAVHKKGNTVSVEIQGLDIYDPIKDEVKPRNVNDIAYWMVDDDYDGSNFIVKQVFFCGGDSSEFDKWKKGLSEAAKQDTKKKAEKTLRIEIDEEAFNRLYGHISHPIEITKKDQKIAVRMISQFGEESTKVITV